MSWFSQADWLSLVLGADPEHYKPDIAYEFTGRTGHNGFQSTDSMEGGVYSRRLLLEGVDDGRPLLSEAGDEIALEGVD